MKKLCRTTKVSFGKSFDIPETHPRTEDCVILYRYMVTLALALGPTMGYLLLRYMGLT